MSHNNGPLLTLSDTVMWALVTAVVWGICGAIVAVGFVQNGLDVNIAGRIAGVSAMLGAMLGFVAIVSFLAIFNILKDYSGAYSSHMALMSTIAFVIGIIGAFSVSSGFDVSEGVVLRSIWIRVFTGSLVGIVAMVVSLKVIGAIGKAM